MNPTRTSALLIAAALAATALPRALAEDLPIVTGDKATLTGGITPVGDTDRFRLDLFPGDRVSVKVKDAGPVRGLISTLSLEAPDGDPIAATVKKQASPKPSFKFEADEAGVHVVTLTGDPGGFGGAEGNYSFKAKIKRVKPSKSVLDDADGGTFAIPVQVPAGALLDVKAKTKKGGFDIEGLFRPDGLPEPGFVDSLKTKNRRSAKGKKFPVSGGFGTYELRGSYDPGSKVKIKFKVRPESGGAARRLADAEPRFDPFLDPFPSSGITGTLITVVGQNLEVARGEATSSTSGVFDEPGGGAFALRLGLVEDSLLDVSIESTGGGFDVTGLVGPDGEEERRFLNALTLVGRTSASTSPTAPFQVSRGTGWYELRGQYDAGARVTIDVGIVRGDGASVGGLPRVWVGTVEVDSAVIENPFDQVLRFRVPEGLTPDATYDISLRNADGQGAVAPGAFRFVPPPTVTALTQTEAGPAGGRSLRILGSDFRSNSVVIFDGAIVQPSFVLSNRIDIVAPPHAPGQVFPQVRDDLGQTATSPVALTYLDIGSNTIDSVQPSRLQGIGGETVTVNGSDFGTDTVLTLDGTPLDIERVSDSQLRFVAPDRESGSFTVRVEDDYEQSSESDVEIVAFTDVSDAAIPEPLTTENAVDGWRASGILIGDVTGDGVDDLVIFRSSVAFGDDAQRPRLRILAGDGSGGFTDATSGVPAVSIVDDWRARAAALVDVDDDGDLDILLLTDEALDGGDRSSLRLLLNDGDGNFSDVTAARMPAATTAGDRNQGVALAVADVDGIDGPDVILIHTEFFQETIDESPPLGDPPPEPPPPPVLVTYYYSGTRVLLNDGDGAFVRDDTALPAVDEDSVQRFEGSTIVAFDPDGVNGIDLLLTADDVREDPESAGSYLRRAVFLENDGSGTFTDTSDTWLPGPDGAEHLQGDCLEVFDHDDDGDLDFAVLENTRLVDPASGEASELTSLRLFANDGTRFTADDVLPDIDGQDALQGQAVAFGDLSGDGLPEILVVAPSAPEFGGPAARILVRVGDAFVDGSEGLPDSLLVDDGRGRVVRVFDFDGDGDLDIIIGRDESDQSVRNTRVFENPRVE